LYVELNSGGDDYFRRHNPLYFPRHTAAIEYDYWVNDADSGTLDDVLQVLVGGAVIDTVSLAAITGGFVRDHRAIFSLPAAGLTATLEFRIADFAGDGVESAVRFDNVELVIQTPPAKADFDADGDVDGSDFLSWQRGLGTYVVAKPGGGDADLDGNVLADDLAVWRAGFGTPNPSTEAILQPPIDVPDFSLPALAGASTSISPRRTAVREAPVRSRFSTLVVPTAVRATRNDPADRIPPRDATVSSGRREDSTDPVEVDELFASFAELDSPGNEPNRHTVRDHGGEWASG
jgi:hypothetical protein